MDTMTTYIELFHIHMAVLGSTILTILVLAFVYKVLTRSMTTNGFHRKMRRFVKTTPWVIIPLATIPTIFAPLLGMQRTLGFAAIWLVLAIASVVALLVLSAVVTKAAHTKNPHAREFYSLAAAFFVMLGSLFVLLVRCVVIVMEAMPRNRQKEGFRQGPWNLDGYLTYAEEAKKVRGERY